MANLSPIDASNLAADVYLTQSSLTAGVFFENNMSLLSSSGSTKMDAEVGFRLLNTKDTFGVCAAGVGDYQNDVFLVFRGSTTANFGADWASNARIGLEIGISGKPVHIGFNHIFKSMVKQLEDFFASLNGVKPQTVHCVGHSLGGAVATLAADWVNHTKRAQNTKVYTFGAPRPATHLFAKSHTDKIDKKNIFRVYHESDPVPMIPVFPFCHAPFGNMAYFIHTKPVIWPFDHKMGKYIESVDQKGKSWQSLSPTGIHEPTDAQLERWLESNIKVQPSETSTWTWISSALFYVLRKIVGFSMVKLQAVFIGAVTLADNIAALLKQGIDMSGPDDRGGPSSGGSAISVSHWVERLMQKIMQILGWTQKVSKESLDQVFMRNALKQLMDKSHSEATRAVRGLTV